jgi:hypothetical protein
MFFAISSCSIQDDIKTHDDRVGSEIERLKGKHKNFKPDNLSSELVYGGAYYAESLTVDNSKNPDWFYEPFDFTSGKSDYRLLFDEIFKGESMNVSYLDGSDEPIYVVIDTKTKGDAIEQIRASTGYNIDISEHHIAISPYVIKVFPIYSYSGEEVSKLGKVEGNGSSSTSNAGVYSSSSNSVMSGAFQSSSSRQYSQLKNTIDVVKDVGSLLETVFSLSKNGAKIDKVKVDEFGDKSTSVSGETYHLNESTMQLYVKAKPSKINMIEVAIRDMNAKLTTNVDLEIDIVSVEYNDQVKFSYDLNVINQAIKNRLDISLNTNLSSALTDVSGELGTLLLSDANASNSGSSVLMQMLQSKGYIVSEKSQLITLQNNRMTNLKDVLKEAYISGRGANFFQNSGGTSQTEQTTLETGFDLNVVPIIFDRFVTMKLTLSRSSRIDLVRKDPEDIIESPTTNDKEITTTLTTASGHSMIVGVLSSNDYVKKESKSGDSYLGKSFDSNVRQVQTLIVVKPVIRQLVRS